MMAPLIDADGWITTVNNIEPVSVPSVVDRPKGDASTSASSSSSSATGSLATDSSATDTSPRLRSRVRPAALRLNSIGVDPSLLIGKKLKHIRRSPTHPVITLSFADDTMYQILVDGYAPRHKSESVPRILEMDDLLQQLFDPPGGHIAVDLVIKDCAFIQLSDKAYERREWEQRWDQKHNAIAFKFDDEKRWHCVWAMLAEHDKLGSCTFRTFDDIYLQPLVRQTPLSPKKAKMPHTPQKNKSRKQDIWRKET